MTSHPSVDWLITQMRIVGGVERYVYWLVCELAKRCWDIRVITIVEDNKLSNQLRSQGIPVLSLSAKSKTDFQILKRLELIWKENKPDILHTHLYHAGILGRLVGKRIGIPLILCHQGGPEVNRPVFRTILDWFTSPLVNRYIVPCEAVEAILQRREKIPKQKIDRIPNGIQPPLMRQSGVAEGGCRDKFIMPIRLVTVGRLVFEKAYWVLVKAVHEMAMRNLRASLWIIGEGPLQVQLQTQIEQLNLTDSVFLIGYQENPFDWLHKSNIFIMTSLWESLSLALMEAMAIGLPVIATATGGTPELITHLENGYLIPPNSPQALADAVEFLYNHPQLARQLGRNAQQLILDNYTIPKVADQLENYYLKLLEENSLR